MVDTIESWNGQRYTTDQGNFIQWFSSNAFGGTNYLNTPVGGVTSVDEPHALGASDPKIFFGLWSLGNNFGICAWNSRLISPFPNPQVFQAVGDPFVTK